MILSWKAVALDTFQAEWQGMTLLLSKDAMKDDGRWVLTLAASAPGAVLEINGLARYAVKQRWTSARGGMASVEEVLNRIIVRKVRANSLLPLSGMVVREVTGHLSSKRSNFIAPYVGADGRLPVAVGNAQ